MGRQRGDGPLGRSIAVILITYVFGKGGFPDLVGLVVAKLAKELRRFASADAALRDTFQR
jgi:hypothetical protein